MSTNILDRKHDRMIADLVNDLTSTSKKYYRADQLRSHISQRISTFREEYSKIEKAQEEAKLGKRVLTQLIVAHDLDGAIGLENGIPWEQSTDMKYFKRATVGTAIVMGSHTFASMGHRPLSERFNIVVTSTAGNRPAHHHRNLEFCSSFEKAMMLAASRAREYRPDNPVISIVGGASLYRQAMETKVVDIVRETLIETSDNKADTYFRPKALMIEPTWKMVHDERRFDGNHDQHSQVFSIFVRQDRILPEDYKRLILKGDSYVG